MKNWKKIISLLLVFAMLCTLSITVLAAEGTQGDSSSPAPASSGESSTTENENPVTATGEEAPAEAPAPAETPDYSELKDVAILNDVTTTTYATAVAAINAAKDGDTVKVFGTILWGGDSTEADKSITITSGTADAQAHIALNGANKYSFSTNYGNDDTPNVTNITCGVTFDNIYLEESQGINFLFANGYPLVIRENVTMASNGSVCSGETSGCNTRAVGGSFQKTVASTSMTLNGGSYEYVIGGGLGQNVEGDVSLTTGAPCSEILGGGYRADVGGNTNLVINGKVGVLGGVYGGGYEGNVGGDTSVTVNGTVGIPGWGCVAGGSCYRGSVTGSTNVLIKGNVGSGVYGGNSGTVNDPNPLGAGNNQRYSQKANKQSLYPAAKTMDKGSVGKDTHVTVADGGVCNEAVYGGGADTPVNGSTYVTVNGTVYGDANAEGVYGGGAYVGGDVLGNTNVTIGETASVPMRQVNYEYMGGDTRIGGAVFGGGRFCAVGGDTNVIVNGKVGSEGLGGLVFGGGYGRTGTGAATITATVAGTSNVTINAAPYAYTSAVHLGRQQYTDKRLTDNAEYNVFWGQSGVFGGGMNCDCDATSVININADMNGNPVYGDSLYEWVTGKSTIHVNKGGVVYRVWGWYDDEQAGEGYYKRADGDYAKIYFDGNTSTAVQLNNLDLVQVTDSSAVTIDNNKTENQQLVNVKDLTIDKSGKLTLPASASISGNYNGDGTGTLVVPANAVTDLSKGQARLKAAGTVTGNTNLSIVDADGVTPAQNQIYVTANQSNTDSAGNYNWTDQRNSVKMGWKTAADAADATKTNSIWYLVSAPTDNDHDHHGGGGTDIPDPNVPLNPGDVLDKENHNAYLMGYEDGNVRPANGITRAEVATIFFRLLKDDARNGNLTTTNSYSDVSTKNWFNTAVSTLTKLGIVKGYEDGSFKPNQAITRGELAAVIARFAELKGDSTVTFSDIDGYWAKDSILLAASNSWIAGYEDGTFRPRQNITRAETVTMINRVLERLPESADKLLTGMKTYPDNLDTSAWYYLAIQEATNSHTYTKSTGSKYETWSKLTDNVDWTVYEH